MIEFTYNSDLSKVGSKEGKYFVRGTALNAGVIPSKNLLIPEKELDRLAESLTKGEDGRGAYILPDHKKETEKVLGRVSKAFKVVDDAGARVDFEGWISDKNMENKIKSEIVTLHSSGITLERQVCSICDNDYLSAGCNHRLGEKYDGKHAQIVAQGIQGREVSTVLYPADKNARFSLSLSEGINEITKKKDELLNKKTLNNDPKIKDTENENENDAFFIFFGNYKDSIVWGA